MSEYIIRPLTEQDGPQAAKLWNLVFGDDESLVLEFFRLFSHLPTFGMGAEYEGKLVAAAYCPEGADLVTTQGTEKGVYLYAVATHPDHRKHGLAKTLCVALRDNAFAHGVSYLFTKPAEDSLYAWYEEKLNAVPVLGCQTFSVARSNTPTLPVTPLSTQAYYDLRNTLLESTDHVQLSLAWFNWESLLHRAYGGGFFRIGDAIADVYWDEQSVAVQEIVPCTEEHTASVLCNALMVHLNKSQCSCTIAGNAKKYVSCAPNQRKLPDGSPWFGPIFG